MAADILNLLIIEDSADDAELLLWQLRKSGYAPSWERVETPEKMLAALARKEWDLVISDYVMPCFSGIEAIKLLKQEKFDIPFIMISGNAGEDTVVAALQAGADHYLPKSQLSRLAPVIDRELAAAAERRQQRQAERERTLLRQAMEAIPLGVTIADTEGRIIYTNSAEAEMHGYEVSALLGEDAGTLAPKECWSQEGNSFTDCNVSIREGVNVRSDGTTFPVQITSAKVFDARGNQLGVATVTEDITERKRSDERLRYMRSHDGLTGLHNRIYFEEELKRLSRSRLFPISFILFDVDGLKRINELKGHGHGDLVLQEAARILAKLFRAEDMIARIGGDEFIAMLPQTSYLAAENKVERIREALEKERSKQGAVNVSLSLGVATSFEAGTLADAIRLADARMYSDKVSRRPLPPWTIQKPRSIFHPSCLLLDFHPET